MFIGQMIAYQLLSGLLVLNAYFPNDFSFAFKWYYLIYANFYLMNQIVLPFTCFCSFLMGYLLKINLYFYWFLMIKLKLFYRTYVLWGDMINNLRLNFKDLWILWGFFNQFVVELMCRLLYDCFIFGLVFYFVCFKRLKIPYLDKFHYIDCIF